MLDFTEGKNKNIIHSVVCRYDEAIDIKMKTRVWELTHSDDAQMEM